jgi:hypothetical protein
LIIASQKDFAAAALKTRCPAPLFAMRAKKCGSVREFFAAATLASVERAVDLERSEVERLMRSAGVGDCGDRA